METQNTNNGQIISFDVRAALNVARINLSQQYAEIEFLLTRNGVGILPKGDLTNIKGKAKQGKTTALRILICALLIGGFMSFTAIQGNNIVLYVDTEMNPVNTARFYKRINVMCGKPENENQENFIALALREYSPLQRLVIIEEAIKQHKPDIVIIDGVRDLLHDFNSIEESGLLVGELMRISKQYNCNITNILHTNKALTDSNMRGHLGTELQNKCAETWEVSKKEQEVTVSLDVSRNKPADDWGFVIDQSGEVQETLIRKLGKTEQKEKVIENIIRNIYINCNTGYSYSELIDLYAQYSGAATSTAKRYVGIAVQRKWVLLGTDKQYRLAG